VLFYIRNTFWSFNLVFPHENWGHFGAIYFQLGVLGWRVKQPKWLMRVTLKSLRNFANYHQLTGRPFVIWRWLFILRLKINFLGRLLTIKFCLFCQTNNHKVNQDNCLKWFLRLNYSKHTKCLLWWVKQRFGLDGVWSVFLWVLSSIFKLNWNCLSYSETRFFS
jgi:hypothetical protein